jgi:cytochrome c biogenesis protein CcmG/thiol:disulfide interchange protein DsbE
MSDSAHSEPEPGRDLAEGGVQPNSKLRVAAIAATAIALLALSIPFVWQNHVDAQPPADAVAPIASHDAAPASLEDGGACAADAKPANLNFTMKDLEGKDVALSSFKGEVMLLNFWATWCGPCKAEIPMFVEFQKQYANQGFTVVGYSVDDEAPKARAFATEYKMNYPILLGLGREDVQDAFGPMWGIPVSVIIDRSGKVCQKHVGLPSRGELEKQIKALL